jgi:hypothetical protein
MGEKSMNNFEKYKSNYERFGTAYIDFKENIFTTNEIKELKQL